MLITCRLRPVVSCRVDAALLPPVPFYTPVGRAALRVGRQASICAATPFAIINAVNRQVQLVGDCSAALDAVQLHAAAATPNSGQGCSFAPRWCRARQVPSLLRTVQQNPLVAMGPLVQGWLSAEMTLWYRQGTQDRTGFELL